MSGKLIMRFECIGGPRDGSEVWMETACMPNEPLRMMIIGNIHNRVRDYITIRDTVYYLISFNPSSCTGKIAYIGKAYQG